jgi:hypothetical protein
MPIRLREKMERLDVFRAGSGEVPAVGGQDRGD